MNKIICVFLVLAVVLSIVPVSVFAEGESSQPVDEPIANKMSQVFFVSVMTIGLIGLPVYFWLNARRNRLLREYNEKNSKPDDDESEDIDE